MANNIRGTHVSPGIYTKETDITYTVKSLGITTLGVVGETLKGPAFQPMRVENWREFQNLFGGTSPEKFRGSGYPKYELPYIAKSYLSESNQLEVCRVLGLSGYNAGPAWAITASDGTENGKRMVIAVLRSRGHYEKSYRFMGEVTSGDCSCQKVQYDKLVFDVGQIQKSKCGEKEAFNMNCVKLGPYAKFSSTGNMCEGYTVTGETQETGAFYISSLNYGKFTIQVYKGPAPAPESGEITYNLTYAVSLNPNDNDYILKVLGTTPFDGTAPLYVESLFDVALQNGINGNEKLSQIDGELVKYQAYNINEYCKNNPVLGLLTMSDEELTKKYVGTRWLATDDFLSATYYKINPETGEKVVGEDKTTVQVGHIYTVRQFTKENGKREYVYTNYFGDAEEKLNKNDVVKNNYDNMYYMNTGEMISPLLCDLNNYKDSYRYASTPWFVSNLKGDAFNYELNKLFRFHTISDGDVSNQEIKVSIQNIKPDNKTFDVIIRDIKDSDESVIILEKFSNCTLIPGDKTYIAYKIGSFDGVYESKSKYITVEVNENLTTENSIPCGFLGYPLVQYGSAGINREENDQIIGPLVQYRVNYEQDVKHRRQYFGLSNGIGVDVDMFKYQGQMAYVNDPAFLSNGFHLDSRLDKTIVSAITVDGESGYEFDCVNTVNRTNLLTEPPIIGSEVEMEGSIYENVDLRKFTAYFYGGFDGWDIYRESRSNTDDFKMNNYQGDFNEGNGEGYSFNRIEGAETLNINQLGITSDWYAYLAGIRQFANPESVDINVFATPGIDIINNTSLVEETIDMIEEERADSIYVVTTPDKPFGAEDYVDEMYNASDVVYELEDTSIDSNYTCTYYPWVKYHDTVNNKYVYLPPTKDVVRNMAMTDNTAHPWFAPAGITRGDVDCVRAKVVTKLADEDILYEGRINPVKTFASDGVKIWGQKNLQVKESQLNRIAVRRLLLRLRKLISISCIGLIFEPNDPGTKNKFLSTVSPILDNIKSNRGISDYRIEVNDTPEARDRRELPVKLFFKPYQALEYITLDFVVTPESVSFDDI